MKRNIFLPVILLVIAVPVLLFAESKSVVINEIAWMGSSVEGVDPGQHWRYEWAELYSTVVRTMVLDGWKMELYKDGKLYFDIPLTGSIGPEGYFLIGASDKISGIDLNYKNLAGKFNNSGQRVVLKNSTGEIVDEVDATKGWPAGNNESKRTMEQKGVSDTPRAGWQTSASPGGTPRAQNSSGAELKPIAQKLSFSKKLSFSETPTKKDTSMSSDEESQNIFNSTTLVALVLALGSSAAILALRKRVLRA